MAKHAAYPERSMGVNPEHIELLYASLRSPSAHNTQPWRIKPLSDGGTYELHYDQNPDLPHDPSDKDAYLTMGAFVETMKLQAPNFHLGVQFTPELSRHGQDIFIGSVAIGNMIEGPIDPLSAMIDNRVTNRNIYDRKQPLTPELTQRLQDLGNALVDTKKLKDVVEEASMESWADARSVNGLAKWLRKDNSAADGLTAGAMNLTKPELLALDVIFMRGRVKSKIMQRLLSSSEVTAFRSAPKAAVLGSKDMTPESLFEAGGRLLRSWTEISAAGYSSHPYSVAVDYDSTIPKVAEIAQVDHPVSLYRVGKAKQPPQATSNRRTLAEVLLTN